MWVPCLHITPCCKYACVPSLSICESVISSSSRLITEMQTHASSHPDPAVTVIILRRITRSWRQSKEGKSLADYLKTVVFKLCNVARGEIHSWCYCLHLFWDSRWFQDSKITFSDDALFWGISWGLHQYDTHCITNLWTMQPSLFWMCFPLLLLAVGIFAPIRPQDY